MATPDVPRVQCRGRKRVTAERGACGNDAYEDASLDSAHTSHSSTDSPAEELLFSTLCQPSRSLSEVVSPMVTFAVINGYEPV